MEYQEVFISYDSELGGNLFTLKCDFGRVEYIKKYKNVSPLYIFVDPKYRRKGIATKMIDYLNKKYVLEWNGRFTDIGRLFFKNYINNQRKL